MYIYVAMYTLCICLLSHTGRVTCHSKYNLMQASNLGVVFGPVLMRPKVETIATINNIKYQNIIVEIMIDEKDKVSLNSVCMCVCVHVHVHVYVRVCVL